MTGATALVLLVGRDAPVTRLMAILEPTPVRVRCATSLAAAEAEIRLVSPDLLILDMGLEGADAAWLDGLRASHSRSFVPVLALYEEPGQLAQLRSDGHLRAAAPPAEVLAQIELGLTLGHTRRELLREREHLALLVEVSQTLHRSLDLDQMLQQTLQQIGTTLGAERGSIVLVDAQGQVWRRILMRALSPADADAAVRHVLRDGLAAYALRSNAIQIVTDALTDPRWVRLAPDETVRSALALPLSDYRSGRAMGVVVLIHSQPSFWSEELLLLAGALNQQLNVALTNAALYTRLREAEDSRDAFIQMLTHDLRTPLTGMISCFDALQSLELERSGLLFVELGLQAGGAQQRMIDDLLDVYKADVGHLDLIFSPTTLELIGQAVYGQLQASAMDSGLELTIDLPPEPVVYLDEHKLIRVLANLVSNSVKWTPRGGAVRVSGSVADRELELRVADTGVGIAPEDQPRIFDRFYQGRARGSRRGTGLGLTFCALVVQAHAGSIDVNSIVDSGTTIIVRLPRQEETHASKPLANSTR